MSAASSNQPVDTSRTIELLHSPLKMFGVLVAGVLMTSLSLVFVLPVFPELGSDPVTHAIGIVGTLFFGLCTIMIVRQWFTLEAVITISPAGLRDVRVAREFVPWSAIERLSTWTLQGQSILVVAVAPEVESRLTLTRTARWTRGANRKLGADGLCITAHGLKLDFASLAALVHAYAAAYGAPAARTAPLPD
ncbi:STM3941 family protein [Nannocystis pusilla]|uniref:STM3941 family protein n=1 Tax=Nannocystis pusilla TaxID=889268 RepID=UPI003DA24581